MLTLINGDGNPRVTAAQDADWYGSLTGEKTCIMPANDKFSATVADANTIEISSGVLITKEGRRVQIDAETIEEIIIPTGTQGTDTYYIIGFHLYIDESGQQVAETFVETMENESDTITETTFREGSTSIYISLYRVKRSGLTLESVTRICPMYEISADEIVYGNTNVGAELTQINQGLSELKTMIDKTNDCHFTNVDNTSRWRCHIIPISDDNGLCVLKATLTPTDTTINYTIPKSTYGVSINAVMQGLFTTENTAIVFGKNGTAGEMFTGTRDGLTINHDYVIDTCYIVPI